MVIRYFLQIALLLVGGAALIMPSGYSLGFYLICFAGLILWLKHRGALVAAGSIYFIGPLLIYAFWQVFFDLYFKWRFRVLEPYWPFIFTIFGVWVVKRYKPRADWFWCGLALGSIGAAVLSGYQALVLGWRAEGYVNSIQFGNISMLLGVLCIARTLVYRNLSAINQLMWIGGVSGFVAATWSWTRGGWLGVIFVFIFIVINVTSEWKLPKRAATNLIVVMVLVIPVIKSSTIAHAKVVESINYAVAFVQNNEQNNSVGIRLALWSVAIKGAGQAPWFGGGDDGWIKMRDSAITEGRLIAEAKTLGHLHNEYLDTLVKRGFVGVLLLTILYFGPTILFFKPYLNHTNLEVRALAICGVAIPIMLINFGLTQAFLSHNSGRVVFCSLWMCVAGLMLNAAETSTPSNPVAPSY